MFTDKEAAEVREYFGVFNPVPSIALDPQGTEAESYILIEGSGLSIGKLAADVPTLGKTVPGHRFYVYDHEGYDDGTSYPVFEQAVRAAMKWYAAELFNRVNDRLSTAALAQEFRDEQAASV